MSMYGKHFEKMYTGSLFGAGAKVFALMGYVISHQKPPDFTVEINPKLVAVMLGEPEAEIEKAIQFLCSPDPKSRSEKEEGRRLVKLGQYLYRVVNGASYHGIKSQEELRAYWRDQKRRKPELGLAAVAEHEHVASAYPTTAEVLNGRLHGLPATAEEVVAFGATLFPPISAGQCRAFFSYYEGQSRKDPNGNVFWVTKGDAVITNWKVKLPQFTNSTNQAPRKSKVIAV